MEEEVRIEEVGSLAAAPSSHDYGSPCGGVDGAIPFDGGDID